MEFLARCRAERLASGLSDTIDDPAVIDALAAILGGDE